MKNKMIIKTLAIFLSTTALLQVSGIPSKLVNGNTVVQANAATKSYETQEEHIMSSIAIVGNLFDGQTLTAVVKDPNGQDITNYCHIEWYRFDYPTDGMSMIRSRQGQISSASKNINDCVKQYTLEKEDIGKYIGIIVEGDYSDPNAPAAYYGAVATKASSLNTKVQPKDYASTRWQNTGGTLPTWWYLNDDGSKASGWKQIGGDWYYFYNAKNHYMARGWEKIDGYWYCLGASRSGASGVGKMLTGWVKDKFYDRISNTQKYKYYYLYSNGVMATNTTINGHYLDSTGAYIGDVDIASAIEI